MFSTLHTNDAPSAVSRLIDMGVKPFLVSHFLKRSCSKIGSVDLSKLQTTLSSVTANLPLGINAEQTANASFMEGAGCDKCGENGFRGRKGVLKSLPLTRNWKKYLPQCKYC